MRHVCLLAAIKLAYSRVPWYEPCLVALPCICTSLSRKKFVALGSGNSWDERTTHAWFPTEIEMMQGRRHAWPLRFHLHACMSIDLIYPIHIYAACSFSQWLQMYSYFLVIPHTWRVRPAGCMHACSMSSQHALCMHGTVQLKTYSYYSAGFWSEWWMPAYVQLDAINSLFSLCFCVHACTPRRPGIDDCVYVSHPFHGESFVYSECMKGVKHADSDCERNKAHRAYIA